MANIWLSWDSKYIYNWFFFTGNAPDIFLLHLQVALYGLFHRLYGMFPYTFLTYLRHHYSKKDNAAAYEESIKVC